MNYHEVIFMTAYAMRPSAYLEIGVNKGYTFNLVAPFCTMSYAVDVNPGTYKYIRLNRSLIWLNMTSEEFIEKKLDACTHFDLVFIDGWHDHKTSMMEFEAIFKKLRPNGIIFLHDTHPTKRYAAEAKCGDTWKTALAIKNNPEYSAKR